MHTGRITSGLLGTLFVAVGAVMLPGTAHAEPIRLSVYNNVAGGMTDNDGDGFADSGGPFTAVLHLSSGFEDRASRLLPHASIESLQFDIPASLSEIHAEKRYGGDSPTSKTSNVERRSRLAGIVNGQIILSDGAHTGENPGPCCALYGNRSKYPRPSGRAPTAQRLLRSKIV
jgi:hypothetical protein